MWSRSQGPTPRGGPCIEVRSGGIGAENIDGRGIIEISFEKHLLREKGFVAGQADKGGEEILEGHRVGFEILRVRGASWSDFGFEDRRVFSRNVPTHVFPRETFGINSENPVVL